MSGSWNFQDDGVVIPLLTEIFRNLSGQAVHASYYSPQAEDEMVMVPLTAAWLPQVGCTMLEGNGVFDCQSEHSKWLFFINNKKKWLSIILYLQSGPFEKLWYFYKRWQSANTE